MQSTGQTSSRRRNVSQKYLLAIALGPVQGFITSARRSRDLWYGSFLLSEMSKFVAKSLAESQSTSDGFKELIFPSPNDWDDLEPNKPLALNVSNKIVAKISGNESSIKKLRKSLEDAAKEFLEEQATKVFNNFDFLNNPAPDNISRKRALQQIAGLLEFYWVAVPLTSDYLASRKHLDSLLAARKSTRNFVQPGWSAPIPKSALDGQNETILPEAVFKNISGWNENRVTKYITDLYLDYGIRPGEHLDGIGFLKRHGINKLVQKSDISFQSTSHMAALPTLERIKTDEQRQAVKTYISKLSNFMEKSGKIAREKINIELGLVPKGHTEFSRSANNHNGRGYDARLLFKERLAELLDGENLKNAQLELDIFLKKLTSGAGKPLEPHSYYVLMHADGDKMGSTISSINDIDVHRDFSKKLADFAKGVRSTIEKYNGCLIYSGGDDVLAYLPLNTALKASKKVASKFKKAMKKFKSKTGKSPTFSVGLVIAHHLEHLEDVLNWSRIAEKAAKNTYGRDALAITLAKRSGVNTTIGGKWDSFYPRLKELIKLYEGKGISHGTAYEVREFARKFANITIAEQKKNSEFKEMLQIETIRILGRKKLEKTKEINDTDILNKLIDNLKKMFNPDDNDVLNNEINYVAILNDFAQEMIIAQEIARSRLHAKGDE